MNTSRLLRGALALAAALACPLAAHADAAPADDRGVVFSPMAGFAFTAGGEPLVHVAIINEKDGSLMGTTAVKAGGQDYLYVGGELRFLQSRMALQGTVGYHWDDKGGIGGDVTFSRVPFELVALWQPLEWLRVGGGLRYDTRAHLTGKGSGAGIDVDFANGFGPVLKTELMMSPQAGIELRWSKVDYKVRSIGGLDASDLGAKADGRSFGVGLDLHY